MSVPGARGSQKRALDPLEMELWILGMEPRASARLIYRDTYTHTPEKSLPTFPHLSSGEHRIVIANFLIRATPFTSCLQQ